MMMVRFFTPSNEKRDPPFSWLELGRGTLSLTFEDLERGVRKLRGESFVMWSRVIAWVTKEFTEVFLNK